MHNAVAVTSTRICSSSPSPASLPSTESTFPVVAALQVTKCGEPARAGAASASAPPTRTTTVRDRRMIGPPRTEKLERISDATTPRCDDRATFFLPFPPRRALRLRRRLGRPRPEKPGQLAALHPLGRDALRRAAPDARADRVALPRDRVGDLRRDDDADDAVALDAFAKARVQ